MSTETIAEKDLVELKPKEEIVTLPQEEEEETYEADDIANDYDAPEGEEEESLKKTQDDTQDEGVSEEERQRRREKRKKTKEFKKQREREQRLRLEQSESEKRVLIERIAALENNTITSHVSAIDSEINKGIRAAETAKAAMQKAEAENDPMTWAKANALHKEASEFVRSKSDIKDRIIQDYQSKQQGGAMETTPQIKAYADTWQRKNADWFDKNDKNLVRAILALDAQVMADGFNPNTPIYWRELEDRSRRLINRPRPAKPKPSVGASSAGGSMRDVGSQGLDKQFVELLKRQGYWEPKDEKGKAMKQRMIDQYRAEQAKKKQQ